MKRWQQLVRWKIGFIKIIRGRDFIHILLFNRSIFNIIKHVNKEDGFYYFCFRFFDNYGLLGIRKKSDFNMFFTRERPYFNEQEKVKVKSFIIFGWKLRIL
jgi:hypothetical protein